MFAASSYRKKMEEWEQWVREEKERRRHEEEEDVKLRERREGIAMGSPMLGVVEEELAPGGGRWQYRNRGGSYVDGVGSDTDEELADRRRAAERDERDRDDAEERGGRSPVRHAGILIVGFTRGDDDASIRNLFIVENAIQC
jgi:hypothetical protein